MISSANGNPSSTKKRPALFHATIIACSLVLAVQILRWELVSLLTPFLEPLLELGIYLFLAAVVLWCLIAIVVGRLRHRSLRLTLVSLGICAATIAIAWLVPFNELELRANFRIHQSARTRIASEIVSGTYGGHVLKSGGRGDLVSLTPGEQSLSDDGNAMVWREKGQTCVLFFAYRGILDSFSGFVYTSDDRPPPADAFIGQPVETQKLSSHWYWYASRN